jgi:hypothetical protein
MEVVIIEDATIRIASLLQANCTDSLQGRSAGNNFDQFTGNDGLTSAVESQRQLVDHFT